MISVTLPIRTVSEANVQEHWGTKARRVKQQRRDVYLGLHNFKRQRPAHPCRHRVTLTRIGSQVMDSDNLQRSLKAVRDEVAVFIRFDDGSHMIEWLYAQEKGDYAVRIQIEWEAP